MNIGEADRITPSPCTNCGKVTDAATHFGERRNPKPNDISLCYYCGHIQAFGDDLKLRELTSAEMIAIAGDPRIITASAAIIYSKDLKKNP
jgi:hypothetical protein